MNRGDSLGEEYVLRQIKDWGYYVLPKTHPESLGYSGLLIALRAEPTGMHFDPVGLQLWLVHGETVQWTALGLMPPTSNPTSVCAGRVVLCDHVGKKAEFFTFGGILESISVPGETVYSLFSLAPVLPITNALLSNANLFAFAVEAALARFSAEWALSQGGYLRQLAAVDPLQLFLACMQSILSSFEESHDLQETYNDFYHALSTEKRWLQQANQWPEVLPSLDNLLSADLS